jgi:PAS domain S-box-containing protein
VVVVNFGAPDEPSACHDDTFDRVLQATGAAFLILDAQAAGCPVVWANDAFARMTGYAQAQIHGRSANVLIGPETDPSVVARLATAVSRGRDADVTVLCYGAAGRPFWGQVTLAPLRDGTGAVTHWVVNLVDVTRVVSMGMERRREVEIERRARIQLGIVAQISDRLVDLDDPHALQEIANLLGHGVVVEWAGFFLNDGGLRAAEGIDVLAPPTGQGWRHGTPVIRVGARPPSHGDSGDLVQALLDGSRDGPADFDVTATYREDTASHWLAAHLRSTLSDRGLASSRVMLLPVAGRRSVVGVLAFVPLESAEPIGTAEDLDSNTLAVLRLTVRRVALAVDNVRLYARERTLAETLQRAMLPRQAQIDDLDVWTYYSPSAMHAHVGGDWYDVLQISPQVVAVVIGDVVGHDVEAAAAMGQVRSVVRSFANEVTTPGPVLERVDQIVASMSIPRAASMVFMTLTQDDGRWEIEYSRAGHLPVLLVRDGQSHLLDDAAGPLIGMGGRPRATGQHDLRPGDALVFYTDGLIERKDRALREGLTTLVELASGITAIDAAGIGEDLLSGMVDQPEDDVAVVVVRLPDPATDHSVHAPGAHRRRWSLPSEPASISRARQAVLRTCRAWGLPDVASAELVASELVANAVLHGWGHLSLRLFDTGEGLRIEVEDANPAPPVTTDGHPGRVGGYGMRIVERLADWGWRPVPHGKLVWARVRPGGDVTAGQGWRPKG